MRETLVAMLPSLMLRHVVYAEGFVTVFALAVLISLFAALDALCHF